MKPKYVVYGGYVKSQYDGDVHYITADKVAYLYGVKHGEWIRYREGMPPREDMIYLGPRSDGNYTLPTKGD